MEFEVQNHILVPKHIKLDKEKAEELLRKYNITKSQLPRISRKDPAIKSIEVKAGDIIKIERNSETAGKTLFFRVVIGE